MKILITARLVNLDLRPRVGVYSSENSPFAIISPVPYYLKFLQKRVGLISRGYGTCTTLALVEQVSYCIKAKVSFMWYSFSASTEASAPVVLS